MGIKPKNKDFDVLCRQNTIHSKSTYSRTWTGQLYYKACSEIIKALTSRSTIWFRWVAYRNLKGTAEKLILNVILNSAIHPHLVSNLYDFFLCGTKGDAFLSECYILSHTHHSLSLHTVFYTMTVNSDIDAVILPNIIFCVPQKKGRHTALDQPLIGRRQLNDRMFILWRLNYPSVT